MTFGEDLGWGSSVQESEQIIERYLELGGNFIDTAIFYTKSQSSRSSCRWRASSGSASRRGHRSRAAR
jgi:aryl-alcohol dehydrogenase-like predicted oxidoreductase